MTAPQPQRSKSFSWKAIFIMAILIHYSATILFLFHHSSATTSAVNNTASSRGEHLSHFLPPPIPPGQKYADKLRELRHLDKDNGGTTINNHQSNNHQAQKKTATTPRILLAGMAFSDTTISDYALSFLLHAACSHNIQSHILLAKRDIDTPLTKKIEALSAHYQPLPVDGKQGRSKCRDFVTVEVAPSEDYLLNMTKSYHRSNSNINDYGMEEDTPNNPWNESNRIARIKRSREYQRQLVIRMLNNDSNNSNNEKKLGGGVDYWTTAYQDAVIGVLDLDLFDYPSPVEVIDVARDYIMMLMSGGNSNDDADGHGSSNSNNNDKNNVGGGHEEKKYHAICSNGLFVMKSRSYNGYRRRYYDTFSTILLPNSWLHVDRVKKRGSLVGEDANVSKMNQDKTLQWILREGRRRQPDKGGEEEVAQHQYQPVPVRSCFNGLTLYRADVWLEPKCRYDSYHKDDDAYLSKRYQHACEHIVFHECLRRVLIEKEGGSGEGFNIAVQPDMTTLWHHLS